MRSPSNTGATSLVLILLLLGSQACSRDSASTSLTKARPASPLSPPSPASVSPTLQARPRPTVTTSGQRDSYSLAIDKAESAQNISQSAQSQDDWRLVASRWQQAVQLMKSVPPSSPYRSQVASKLAEYQRNWVYAQKQAAQAESNEIAVDSSVLVENSRIPSSTIVQPDAITSRSSSSQSERVFQTRIKRRVGRTPVIDVTFNGEQTFEMIVDTGASGTVITEQMAASLGVTVVGRAKVNTASERNVEVPLAYVQSISVGGAIAKEVIVAIGSSALEVGLLGHDFFEDYDVTVKQDTVEFRLR